MASVWLTPRWPDFGRMTLSDNERQRKPLRAVLAGRQASVQVTDTRDTVYGSEGWGFESLRARDSFRWSAR